MTIRTSTLFSATKSPISPSIPCRWYQKQWISYLRFESIVTPVVSKKKNRKRKRCVTKQWMVLEVLLNISGPIARSRFLDHTGRDFIFLQVTLMWSFWNQESQIRN